MMRREYKRVQGVQQKNTPRELAEQEGGQGATGPSGPARQGPCTITPLARQFGFSRSTLLYYDRIGLLTPSGRSEAGYRHYTGTDRQRLVRICGFRRAGLSLAEIRTLLAAEGKPSAALLEQRFHELGAEILALKEKQALLMRMLQGMASADFPPVVDRQLWVEMLQAAGMDKAARQRWHAEFEKRAPQSHHDFLRSLGIDEAETLEIRSWSRGDVRCNQEVSARDETVTREQAVTRKPGKGTDGDERPGRTGEGNRQRRRRG